MSEPASSRAEEKPASVTPTIPKQIRSSSWLRNLSRWNLATLLLLYITSLHIIGLYIFTKGFLLTRLTIPHVSPSYTPSSPAPIPATHSKAVILVIDALRTDFISPHYPSPKSPYHHGILTLPSELSASQPDHSLIYNAFSDPPTATMQRIKGITTGSLPTFIDISSNFASTAIEEDSLITQLLNANKTIGFMGDDTWVNLFPDSFNLSHPYDSFNVEDLHTVDEGVIENIFPYLQPANQSRWDVLIGHFLGVDHVGHRVGPNVETMKTKLDQMDKVLRQIVDSLDDDTLLVLLGDHGMDDKGNHGGDSELETSSAMWLYSKSKPLKGKPVEESITNSWPYYTFPNSKVPLRHINQIDLVPTLSLLLGIPIPYNNLGSIIPECFSNDLSTLEAASRANAEQIDRYLSAYGDESLKAVLQGPWSKARATLDTNDPSEGTVPEIADHASAGVGKVADWIRKGKAAAAEASTKPSDHQAQQDSINHHRHYSLLALRHLRALWAQFSLPLILIGSLILGLSVLTLTALYVGVRNNSTNWDIYARLALETSFTAAAVIGSIVGTLAGIYTAQPSTAIKAFVVTSVIVSEIVIIFPLFLQFSLPQTFSINRYIGPFLLFAHAISFASNSFIMWEDRMVLFLLTTNSIIYLLKALSAPTADMRIKIIGLSLAYAIIVRLASTITVCREEQQPYCRVTFYSGNTPVSPRWVVLAIIPLALQLPRAIGITLSRSKSLAGSAPFYLGYLWRGILVLNSTYWVLEYLEYNSDSIGLTQSAISAAGFLKIWLARISIGINLGALPYIWLISPLCITVEKKIDQSTGESQVSVLGFANSYGSTYILFYIIPFTLVHLTNQPMGQLVLSALLVGQLVYLELVDTRRDAVILQQSFATNSGGSTSTSGPGNFDGIDNSSTIVRPSFTDLVPLVLSGFIGFYSTGHQAVLSSIQWKSAFIGFNTVTYPISPLLVIINTWGPFFLSAMAIPLLALWNISPIPSSSAGGQGAKQPILTHVLQLILGFLIYHTLITFSSAITSAWLRRHLMVWKVFAPRFMLSGVTLLIVDLGCWIALLIGVRVTSWKVKRTFGCESI
ncbi:phosphatidylinositol glycan, class O [Kwoniella mangroviensis CBS 8886]|uniref:uncharacterized protein n=1 Tax=Kwoniella mangroviensis CBS 8507 TaxID=1296122 RepID=UPI00080D3FD6|nr:phosphatidylinositol glycan, class O [Kwoniella mangroviensis CBS 8507]OCF68149.1 phosphatidylinositol glycan, class O [Kwoniella mangroviensis CBS 8507]OCF78077.1 phosphatidylinositol glycan, class O [Kwoniella mangroviensis CBS 8886]